MKSWVVLIASALLFVGCASTEPAVLWQGSEPTQQISQAQFDQALFNAKAIPGAEVEDSSIQTSIKIPNASNPKAFTLYIFTKPASYAHPAAAKMTFKAGQGDNGKGPDFRFLQVGDKPEFKRFVREILMAGMMAEAVK